MLHFLWNAARNLFAKNTDYSRVIDCSESLCVCACDESRIFDVAIIGGGISGSSCAYWLSQLGRGRIRTDIYEKSNSLGGRSLDIEFEGSRYEVGGSIFHKSNLYAMQFIDSLGLSREECKVSNSITAIYNGKKVVFKSSRNGLVNFFLILLKYGVITLFRFRRRLANFLDRFNKVYCTSSGRYFNSVTDFIIFIFGSDRCLRMSGRDSLVSVEGLRESFVNEILEAGSRCNYGGQGASDLNDFAFMVSSAGMEGDKLFYVKGGNRQISEKLALLSGSTIYLQTLVDSIDLRYKTIRLKECLGERKYDAIVIANPIDMSRITLEKVCLRSPLDYRTLHVLFVSGILCKEFSSCSSIFTTGDCDTTEWFSVGLVTSVDSSVEERRAKVQEAIEGQVPAVFKIFSRTTLKLTDLLQIFSEIKSISKTFTWNCAYPDYKNRKAPELELSEGVYYTCGLEWAASAMEISLISGSNAAMKIRDYFLSRGLVVPFTERRKNKNN